MTTVPELASFRARLSAAAQTDFDRSWHLMWDEEESGSELILTLRQSDEQALSARALAQERQAIRAEFRVAAGIESTEYTEDVEDPDPTPPDHLPEIGNLLEVIDTATALLAILMSHSNITTAVMERGPYGALLAQQQPATADDIFAAAGWELNKPAQ